jgi:hypothetical protein
LDTAVVIAELEAQRDRLEQAIAALRGSRNTSRTLSEKADGRKRPLSAAARRKIGQAMKKNWAERKKAAV